MFQSMSEYKWRYPPHVIVFPNQPPQSNALSVDRMVLLEILGKDYDFAIRHATCKVELIQRTKKYVSYRYVSQQATSQDIKKLTKASHFIFSDEELAYQQIQYAGTEHIKCFVSNYMGLSEPIYENESSIPQNVIALVMAHDEENEKIKKKFN